MMKNVLLENKLQELLEFGFIEFSKGRRSERRSEAKLLQIIAFRRGINTEIVSTDFGYILKLIKDRG